LALAFAPTACGDPAVRPRPSSADVGAWLTADPPERAPAGPGTPFRSASSDARVAPREHDVGPLVAASPTRPPRHGRVDVNLEKADLTSAFQLLAEAGRFNVVIQEGLHGQVSARLRGVDAYDALLALAEANGAVVRFEGEVVLVTRR
jgi:hypothetical protein